MSREIRTLLAGLGAVGHDLIDVDWAATPLGPMDGWPQSLQTAVRILATSRFSEAFIAAARHLGADQRSLPFTLTYLFDEDRATAHLACATGCPIGHPITPAALSLAEL